MEILNDLTTKPKFAPIKRRIPAALIDYIIYFGIGYFIGDLFGMSFNNEEGFGFHLTALPALLFLLSWIPLIPLSEGLTGQTIGKRILKIKVVNQDYSRSNFKTSLIRHIFDIFDIIFLIGFIIASVNSKKQRIGDQVARTYVVMKD